MSYTFLTLAGGREQAVAEGGKSREPAAGIFANEPPDDWNSLRADLDQALSEAQGEAAPQPAQPGSPHSVEKEKGEKEQIPQVDGASDLWQQGSWSLSPHIVDPEPAEGCREEALCGSMPDFLEPAATDPAQPGQSSQEHEQQFCTLTPARHSADITFTPSRNTAADEQRIFAARSGRRTAHARRRATRLPARERDSQIAAIKMLPASGSPQQIPQLDGSSDGRPRRLGSSWNRGKGRLLRQPSSVAPNDLQQGEQSQRPEGSQREDSQRGGAQKEGSQRGSSQRYVALAVQQSPQKSSLKSQAQTSGIFYATKLA